MKIPVHRSVRPFPRMVFGKLLRFVLPLAAMAELSARQWHFEGIAEPVEADYVAMGNGFVVLRGGNGTSFEVPLDAFGKVDGQYVRTLAEGEAEEPAGLAPGKPVTTPKGYKSRTVEKLAGQWVSVGPGTELRVTGDGDPIAGSVFHFEAADGWLFFEKIPPSVVVEKFLDRFLVNKRRAEADGNIRVVRHGAGSVVIPHGPGFPALTVHAGASLSGVSENLECHVAYDGERFGGSGGPVRSFVLRRGYMATLAVNADGTGHSRNYVAQDHDVVVPALPKEFGGEVRFVRVFPWRWTSKKGIAGGIWQDLNLGWFYDWNIGADSSPDLEYVPIKQKRWWPGLDQDWKAKGSLHLLGYNEPDRPDQANMSVDEAIAGWPELLRTGLRLGSPAVSDGGLGWLYEFMEKAEKEDLRVDFVAVHYYRATADPGDAKGAAEQFHRFLKDIHDRVRRPLWVTEWNNGANWTNAPDPNERQQKAAVEAMIKMLDETPFVERYALYNWVEDVRRVKWDDGSLTPAGEVYRDKVSPVAYEQEERGR